jgi:L-amino acid N-acyltransferase YncA
VNETDTIRPAEPRDAADLARIYNQAMKPGVHATCDVTPVTRENRIEWLTHHGDRYPVWVYEHKNGGVVGWSSLSPFSVRSDYSSIAEISVYVDESRRSLHIGGKLLIHLVSEARALGFRSLVSLAFEKNVISNAGCVVYGFKPAAVLYEVAELGGTWENVLWLQKDLLEDDPSRYSKRLLSPRNR